MIEFHETLEDLNNAQVWEICIEGTNRKIGTLMKNELTKKYYLDILYKKYTIPFSMRDVIVTLCEIELNGLDSDILILKIHQSDWNKIRVARVNGTFYDDGFWDTLKKPISELFEG